MNFEECCENGGKVKTKQLKNNRYINICYDKKGNPHTSKVYTTETMKIETEKCTSKVSLDSLIALQKHFNDK